MTLEQLLIFLPIGMQPSVLSFNKNIEPCILKTLTSACLQSLVTMSRYVEDFLWFPSYLFCKSRNPYVYYFLSIVLLCSSKWWFHSLSCAFVQVCIPLTQYCSSFGSSFIYFCFDFCFLGWC